MPYEPLVLLRKLAPEDVNHLTQQNPLSPPIINREQNVQTFPKNEENVSQSEKIIVKDNSITPSENKQLLTCSSPSRRILTTNLNGTKHDNNLDDKLQQETFLKDQVNKNCLKSHSGLTIANKPKNVSPGDIFRKELVVVIDNCYNDVIRTMVNSTAQHPKTRNPTNTAVATNSNNNSTSENTASSTRDSALVKDHITDETIMIMTTKSPLSTITHVSEVIDKKIKEDSLNNQRLMTTEELNKQTNHDKMQHDSSGLSLRTRTISSTIVPAVLQQLTASTANSIQHDSSTSKVTSPRPRGRPKRSNQITLNRIANSSKILKPTTIKKVGENKDCILTMPEKEFADTGLGRLGQQMPVNQCNGTASYNDKQEYNNINVHSSSVKASTKHSTLSQDMSKSKECVGLVSNKKSVSRKRKQSDAGESVAEKRQFISNNSKDSLVIEINSTDISLSSIKSNEVEKSITYSFTLQRNLIKMNIHYADLLEFYSYIGHTYWPINWEYSKVSLTGHIQRKLSKDSLRKIRFYCNKGVTNKTMNMVSSFKTNSTLKKYQASAIQRRGSANKLSSLACVEVSAGSKHQPSTSSTIVKRRIGRPPGRKNKILQTVIKSNSPRKSPRQHASTLAAIMSTKDVHLDDKLVSPQSDDLVDLDAELNKNSIDSDGPCILPIAVPKNESKCGVRRYRRRRQLDRQHSILERRRKRRSITPPPPKLCAQQPAPPRKSMNVVAVGDQEVVKLRTKNVDLVRRRARDERLREAFVCQQLQRVYEIAELNRYNLMQDKDYQENLFSMNSLPLGKSQTAIWSSLIIDSNITPDNMSLQIMYEQTGDKRFLSTKLTDETLQIYNQQRDLVLAERLSNNYGDTGSCDIGTDIASIGNKRKKKRPNMTGWPKEKRRKIISASNSSMIMDAFNNENIDRKNIAKRRRAINAEQQNLKRRRIKLEKQQLAKDKSKAKMLAGVIPKRPGRRPGPIKKDKTKPYRRTTSTSSSGTIKSNNTSSSNSTVKERKRKVKKKQQNNLPIQNKIETVVDDSEIDAVSSPVVKRSLGRPKGSMGHRKRIKLALLNRRSRNHTSLPPEQQKENMIQPQTSTGKLKCVISTRNNRIKLLSSSSSTSSQKRTTNGGKNKKSTGGFNISCLPQSLSETVVGKSTRTTAKRRRLQQQLQQQQITSATWDVGRPKRYHTTNHSKSASNVAVEEDYCFVGSQPFEQHCPGVGGGLSQNTVLENQDDHLKENTIHNGL